MNRKIALLLLLALLLPSFSSAAIITGTIYDSQLEVAKDARLEINTEPKQVIVSKDGTYSFNVPNGEYTLTAEISENNEAVLRAEEKVSVVDEGTYTIDLIMFDVIENTDDLLDIDVGDSGLEENKSYLSYIIVIASLLLCAIVFVVFIALKKNKIKQNTKHASQATHEAPEQKAAAIHEEKDDLKKIIAIIKAEGGRATQLEIRKHFPLSEAKISLMIAELEDKKILRKIKKGRGNIIILN